MKVFILLLIIGYFSSVECFFGLLGYPFIPNASNRIFSCPFHRCRNVDKREYLIKRNLSPDFPYHHLQHLRGPNTRYSLVGTNAGNQLLDLELSRPGAFLAYDSTYDPQYDPCTDCDDSGYGGEYCMIGKCYIERTYLIGRN